MSEMGKRYHCDECGAEILCVKSSNPEKKEQHPNCCGKQMRIHVPKKGQNSGLYSR